MRIIAQPAFRNRTSNPYTWLLYSHMGEHGVEAHEYSGARLMKGDYAVWHLHWPEVRLTHSTARASLWRIIRLRYMLDHARRRGTKIVWTVHNLRSHEQLHPWVERMLWRTLVPRVDAHISLSSSGRAAAVARFPELADIPGFVIPHGHYRDAYPNTISRAEARRHLGIAAHATVLATVGLIRPYKNIPGLIAAFRGLSDSNAILLIQGAVVRPESEPAVRAAAKGDPRVRLDLRFIPDGELQLYLNAADLIVLPFQEILNSGSALLALSYDRPILVPDAGPMAELQHTVGETWVRTYPGSLSADDLNAAIGWVKKRPLGGVAPLHQLDWNEIARTTASVYRQITQ